MSTLFDLIKESKKMNNKRFPLPIKTGKKKLAKIKGKDEMRTAYLYIPRSQWPKHVIKAIG
jgi:hypothetical protein